MKSVFDGVFRSGRKLFTMNMIRGYREYTRSTVSEGGKVYREWDPGKSKPAAAIMKGIKKFPLSRGSKVLYLGAASGATCSFFSDIIGEDGVIYAVEISERSVRDLNNTSEARGNIVPILADARKPEEYEWVEPVDIVFQDVASDDQAQILVRNAVKFLKKGGYAMIAIKSRSIDVTKPPREVYKDQLEIMEKKMKVLEKVELDPFEKDHLFVIMQMRT
ncbi:MAG: fibrillarin-like rRNA/tRNA 2'-O-methyltransferase [Candidatus Aenigmarchaeota archaeon]|nr:fibrillarin-like rRNA/tRNA 2'-O-methyltransferase [Candidatus Aenigmarchaeota archaeon]